MYSSDQMTWQLLAQGRSSTLVEGKYVHIDWSYECTLKTVNVFVRGLTLPGHSEMSIMLPALYQLQLCTVLGSSARKLWGLWYTVFWTCNRSLLWFYSVSLVQLYVSTPGSVMSISFQVLSSSSYYQQYYKAWNTDTS